MARVGTVAGRYEQVTVDGVRVRLLLAKNPAGWAEALDLIRPAPLPVVVGINARVADGRDPSWLWDVPFEKLRGRQVVATGERGRDLAVRLRYAGVPHTVRARLPRRRCRAAGGPEVDLAANYTSFQDARLALAPVTDGDRRGRRGLDRRALPRAARAPTATAATPPSWPGGCEWRGIASRDRRGDRRRGRRPTRATSTSWAGARTAPRPWPPASCSASRALHRAVDGGAAVLAVCAGFQLLGTTFVGPDGTAPRRPGPARLLDRPGRRRPPGGRDRRRARPRPGPARAHRLREPRRRHRPRPRRPAPGQGRRSATATTRATAPRGRSAAGSWAPTSTGRCWPATRPWPTTSSRRSSAPSTPLDDAEVDALREERWPPPTVPTPSPPPAAGPAAAADAPSVSAVSVSRRSRCRTPRPTG